MKLASQVLVALCALQSAAAFTLEGPKATRTALFQSSPSTQTSTTTATSTPSPSSPGGGLSRPSQSMDAKLSGDIWEVSDAENIQGGMLRTWSFPNPNVERLVLHMTADDKSLGTGEPLSLPTILKEGRLVHAKVDLCQGPDNTPMKMEIRSGKGKYRPIKCIIETPGDGGSLFVRNMGTVEFPFIANVAGASGSASPSDPSGLFNIGDEIYDMKAPKIVQGGAITTYPLDASVASAKVVMKTDGRPLNASIELVQGPNAIKVSIDLYTEDGLERPFFTIIESPGAGNVIRIINTATVEFPLTVSVEPYVVEAMGGRGGPTPNTGGN